MFISIVHSHPTLFYFKIFLDLLDGGMQNVYLHVGSSETDRFYLLRPLRFFFLCEMEFVVSPGAVFGLHVNHLALHLLILTTGGMRRMLFVI
ncbi:Serine/arginine-rich splicing factor RSZ22 [Zea mays]|uniref:Serine/arginine-rich splicing factor RSZ22 n=1 Tax=Zea mays TaxID=4577 RepID=A0A1D6HMW6_MAIZE|nr:Serine/arginine-rich splicing factor RSZ22 [Zea mays]AQK75657.1 Serine/arginine-rich splicing factor RSZ22 [Zea mays]AQK75659.1 Serine/arginine-rich splicing factor RSZ22 [Zea mays]